METLGDAVEDVESGNLSLSGSGFVVVCVVLFQTRGVRNCIYIFVGVGRTFQGLSCAVAVDSLSSLLSSFWALHLQSFDLSSGTKDSKFED